VLTVKQKLKLIEKFENGESGTKLWDRDTNRTWHKELQNEVKIPLRDCDSGARPSNHRSMKKSSYEEVDVIQWFNQK
jgi:hypothetical protein